MIKTLFGRTRRCFSSSADGLYHRKIRSTTILAVRKGGHVAIIGDGQVSQGNTVMKNDAKKVRMLKGGVACGIAGGVADAFTLLDHLERQIEEHPGQLMRSCVELAKLWRSDKMLRNLSAEIIACDKNITLLVDGSGNCIQSSDGVLATGSGSTYATAAARALMGLDAPDLSALEIAKRSMQVASDICVFTNGNFTIEHMESVAQEGEEKEGDKTEEKTEEKK